MSINHAIADACGSARTPVFAIPSPRHLALAIVARLASVLQRRRTAQAFAGYPDHLLVDMGFERGWDGSIVRIVDDPRQRS